MDDYVSQQADYHLILVNLVNDVEFLLLLLYQLSIKKALSGFSIRKLFPFWVFLLRRFL